MIRALKELVHLSFAFDHHNYARWIPVFIQDLETLTKRVKAEFEMAHFVIIRSCFSSLPIDKAQEQNKKKIKGVRVNFCLTENPQILERWMVVGPGLCRVVEKFEGVQNTNQWIATSRRRSCVTASISLSCQRFNWCYPYERQSFWTVAEKASIPGR